MPGVSCLHVLEFTLLNSHAVVEPKKHSSFLTVEHALGVMNIAACCMDAIYLSIHSPLYGQVNYLTAATHAP